MLAKAVITNTNGEILRSDGTPKVEEEPYHSDIPPSHSNLDLNAIPDGNMNRPAPHSHAHGHGHAGSAHSHVGVMPMPGVVSPSGTSVASSDFLQYGHPQGLAQTAPGSTTEGFETLNDFGKRHYTGSDVKSNPVKKLRTATGSATVAGAGGWER